MKHIAEHRASSHRRTHEQDSIRNLPRVTSHAIFPPTYGAPVSIFCLFSTPGHPSSFAIGRYKERPSRPKPFSGCTARAVPLIDTSFGRLALLNPSACYVRCPDSLFDRYR